LAYHAQESDKYSISGIRDGEVVLEEFSTEKNYLGVGPSQEISLWGESREISFAKISLKNWRGSRGASLGENL